MARRSKTASKAGALALALLALLLSLAPSAQAETCGNEELRKDQHATYLPDCRAYEMVSPPDKNGGNLIAYSGRTRAAADGSAIQFQSLTPFGDVRGSSIATEYESVRSSEGPGPLDTGWLSHAITPYQDASSFSQLDAGQQPLYVGEFTPDLGAGAFFATTPLTEDSDVASVPNLYLRTDLRTPGPGSFRLITACPRCREIDEKEGAGKGALPPLSSLSEAITLKPWLAALSPDGGRALFESARRLTGDTLAGSYPHLYEWHDGIVRLVGRIPSGAATTCDDASGPVCKRALTSVAGQGAGNWLLTPHVLSDGSDGRSRAFFTYPTNDGVSARTGFGESGGRVYVREDGHYTAELNAPEAGATSFAPAYFWDASATGGRAFFTTTQALTGDAALGGPNKLYMYDASKPGSDPHNLTFISPDNEPADNPSEVPGTVSGVIGVSHDGSYVYFIAAGQLVAGAPPLGNQMGIYLWHEGTLSFIEDFAGGSGVLAVSNINTRLRQARVSPDGTHLLYPNMIGKGQQLILYDASTSTPTEPDAICVSCPSGGGLPEKSANDAIAALTGATGQLGTHENHPLSDDGRFVFFSTAEALVPEDTNGFEDAYEYDTQTEELHLLSSGTEELDSWFLDATPDGANVFILTAQPLVGWDSDQAYDLYDVRINGGFPEPTPKPARCASIDACAEAQHPVPTPPAIGSDSEFPGNPPAAQPKTCPKGKRAAKRHGHTICVNPKKHRRRRR